MHDQSLCIIVNVNPEPIPSIRDNPMRLLGKTISDALSDKYKTDSLTLALTKGLVLMTNSHHDGVRKMWILYHLLVACL